MISPEQPGRVVPVPLEISPLPVRVRMQETSAIITDPDLYRPPRSRSLQFQPSVIRRVRVGPPLSRTVFDHRYGDDKSGYMKFEIRLY